MFAEPLIVAEKLAQAFDGLGIKYAIVGSFASSLFGVPRATDDVDLIADVTAADADAIAGALRAEFYVDADMIRDATARGVAFNVIHLESMFKADVFAGRGDAWGREQMARARAERVSIEGRTVTIKFASAEDVLLHKLVWYRLGDEVSDRQWGDVIGLLRIQGATLDAGYMARWAPALGVADLLTRAQATA